jgi:F0F1-type ATP synthase membrane subunit c/vacuolar-type H+-ATPase subunit K
MRRIVCAAVLVMALTGCGSTSTNPLIADKAIQLTAKTSIKYSTLYTGLILAAAIYIIYDPLAPNWEIEESKLTEDVYRFSLKMKRYHTGGAGESIQILKRRASQLQYEQGFANYQILEYTEGIDSQTIGARRMAEGTIKLVQREQADSFRLNDRY